MKSNVIYYGYEVNVNIKKWQLLNDINYWEKHPCMLTWFRCMKMVSYTQYTIIMMIYNNYKYNSLIIIIIHYIFILLNLNFCFARLSLPSSKLLESTFE